MKKLLAIVLAMVMAMAVFAVGISASGGVPSDFEDRIRSEMFLANEEPLLYFWVLEHEIMEHSAAFINGRAGQNAFWTAVVEAAGERIDAYEDAFYVWYDLTRRWDEYYAAYRSGRLEEIVRAWAQAEIELMRAIMPIAENFLRPQALDFGFAAMRFDLTAHNFTLPGNVNRAAFLRDFFDILDDMFEDFDEYDMQQRGQWAELAEFYRELTDLLVARVLAAGGTVPNLSFLTGDGGNGETPAPPWHETLPAFVQFIFRWIFFGWLWM